MIWLILGIALVLRLINLNQSLWLDEGTQANLALQPLSLLWFGRVADFHPPLSYILAHFWILGGKSEVWLRLLPVGFGVASVLVLYYLAHHLFDKKLALISAFFLSIAPYHIYYSQEFRMYSLATFFAVCSMLCFVKLFSRSNGKWKAGFVVSTVLLLYTHYLGIILLVAQLLWLFISKRVRNFTLLYGVLFFLYVPWIPQFLQQLRSGLAAEEYLPGWSSILSLPLVKALPLTFIKFSIGRIDFDTTLVYGAIAAVVFFLYGFIFLQLFREIQKDKNIQLVALWLVVPILLAIIISGVIPLNQPFRLLFVLPAFYLLLAVSVGNAKKWKRLLFLSITTVSLSGLIIYYTQPQFWREDWKGAYSYIKTQPLENAVVLFAFPEPFAPYQWYEQGATPAYGVVKKFPAEKQQINQNLQLVMQGKDTAYLFQYLQPLTDPGHEIEGWLHDNGFHNALIKDIRGVGFIYTYQKK